MMCTHNKIVCTTLMGPPLQIGALSSKGALRDFQVIIQRSPYGIWVLGSEACSKNKRQFLPASPSCSSTNVPAHSRRSEWRQRKVFIREIMSHTRR